MIGKLSGTIGYVAGDHALLETPGGVGYVVYCAPRVLAGLPRAGGGAALWIETVVREDSFTLYGFPTLVEKEWHRLLTSVQGVGAKASLAILDALGPDGVSRAIALGDSNAIKRAQGVGPKLALRVANELRDKAPDVMALGALAARTAQASAPPAEQAIAPSAPVSGADEASAPDKAAEGKKGRAKKNSAPAPDPSADRAAAEADALSALVNLGYPAHEAAGAVAEAARSAEADGAAAEAAALIKLALKSLAGRL